MAETMPELLGLCTEIDRAASEAYKKLADAEDDPSLRECWNRMSEEEQQHANYWARLVKMAREGLVPQLFDKPDEALEELTEVEREVKALLEGSATAQGVRERAMLALRLEFHMLHPAFETLMHFLKNLPPESPEERYDEHLDSFLLALGQATKDSPDLELLARTTRLLWLRNRELLNASHTDALTDLHNYRGFREAIFPLAHLARRRGEQVAMLTLDVDGFKEINDELGHAAGDEVLRTVGRVLRCALREADVPCRLGGDTFVAFLVGADRSALAAIARRIHDAVAASSVGGRSFTVSIGVVHGLLEGDVSAALEHLLHHSDACLRQAKRRGPNRTAVCELERPCDAAPAPEGDAE